MQVELTYELGRLRDAMQRYGLAFDKAEGDVVARQSKNLSIHIRAGLKKVIPAKGSIRSEQIAAMHSGRGVKVRSEVMDAIAKKFNLVPFTNLIRRNASGKEAARLRRLGFNPPGREGSGTVSVGGKQLNFRALAVQRELNVRESGRGFLAFSTPRAPTGDAQSIDKENSSRYGYLLSEFMLRVTSGAEFKYALLRWVGGKSEALRGLNQPKQMAIVVDAVRETTTDIMNYIEREHQKAAREAGLS